MHNADKKLTIGVIVGNRGFFPDHLAKSGREEILAALSRAGMNGIALDTQQSKYGAVERMRKPFTEQELVSLVKRHTGS